MEVNWLERLYVNSSLRGRVHQPHTLRTMLDWMPDINKQAPLTILELGCGCGRGLELIHHHFPNATLIGGDIDSSMLKTAHAYLSEKDIPAKLMPLDTEAPKLEPNSIDIVFSFGAIHHVPKWQHSLQNISALLRKNAYFCTEEYYTLLLENPVFAYFFTHPPHRFSAGEFLTEAQKHNLEIIRQRNIVDLTGVAVFKKH